MPTFQQIPDAIIAAYKPVTGRLATRYSRNIKGAAGIFALQRPGAGLTSGNTASSSYVLVATKRVFCPLAGPVTFVLFGQVTKDTPGTGDVYIEDRATSSQTAAFHLASGTTFDSQTFTLNISNATADEVRNIDLYARTNSTDILFNLAYISANYFRPT
jgi:hypothetical protein